MASAQLATSLAQNARSNVYKKPLTAGELVPQICLAHGSRTKVTNPFSLMVFIHSTFLSSLILWTKKGSPSLIFGSLMILLSKSCLWRNSSKTVSASSLDKPGLLLSGLSRVNTPGFHQKSLDFSRWNIHLADLTSSDSRLAGFIGGYANVA